MNGTWLTLFAVGAVTFAYRLSCIEFGASARSLMSHPRFGRLLRFGRWKIHVDSDACGRQQQRQQTDLKRK